MYHKNLFFGNWIKLASDVMSLGKIFYCNVEVPTHLVFVAIVVIALLVACKELLFLLRVKILFLVPVIINRLEVPPSKPTYQSIKKDSALPSLSRPKSREHCYSSAVSLSLPAVCDVDA
jgi:hypothetical protein